MSKQATAAGGSGIGIGSILFCIFLVLKLCKVIDWSWWWVTAPLWGPLAIWAAVLILIFVVAIAFSVLSVVFGADSKKT